MSRANHNREFTKTFSESPYPYLLTRRLERAATLLRITNWSVVDICMAVGLTSVGSFTTKFTTVYGRSPAAYRGHFPPAAVLVPGPAVCCAPTGVRSPAGRNGRARIEKTRPGDPACGRDAMR